MKLLPKTLAIVFVAFAALLTASLWFYYTRVLNDFLQIEGESIRRNAARVTQAMEAERELLRVTAIDWAQWDDMYDYMETPNEKFEESWNTYESYKALKITDTLFLDLAPKLEFGVHVDFEKEEVVPLSDAAPTVIDAISLATLFKFEGEVPSRSLFTRIQGQLVLAASSPILDSGRTKPSRGTMIILKHVDDEFISKLAKQTQLTINVVDIQQDTVGASVQRLFDAQPGHQTEIRVVDDSNIQAFVTVRDQDDKPAMLLRIDQDRPVYRQGLASLQLFFWFAAISSTSVMLLIVMLLNRFVLTRLKNVGSFLYAVSKTSNFEQRLSVSGSDELAQVALDINQMLESLSQAHLEVIQAQRVAETANAAKSAFIAKVSHELRSPIASITGMHRIVLKRNLSKPLRELITTADRSAWDMLSIINEILDFSKAESGNLTIESIAFNVRDVLRDTISIVAARLEDKPEVEFVCDVNSNVSELLIGDPTKLKQVLVNLLGNAAKFTERGHIALRVEKDSDGQMSFRISDTGLGIPKDKLNYIFEPFKQADETVSRNFQGTGLGLAIVKQFVEVMGGAVSIESEEGVGTTFTVCLPLMPVQTSEANSHKSWPATVLFAEPSFAHEVLLKNIGLRCGSPVQQIDPFSITNSDIMLDAITNAELVIASEYACRHSQLIELLTNSATQKTPVTIIMARPSSVELRESLHAAGLENVLATPIIVDDIYSCYLRQTASSSATQSSEDNITLSFPRKLHVIIADDMPTNRLILEDLLEEAGHTVTSVADGKTLFDCIAASLKNPDASERFDIVITDITMPVMDGYAATRAVREMERKSGDTLHLPIIAVTAHALGEEHQRIKAAGVDSIISKPIRPEDVAAEFKRLLK